MDVITARSILARIRRDGGIYGGGWNRGHDQALFSGSKEVTRGAVNLGG